METTGNTPGQKPKSKFPFITIIAVLLACLVAVYFVAFNTKYSYQEKSNIFDSAKPDVAMDIEKAAADTVTISKGVPGTKPEALPITAETPDMKYKMKAAKMKGTKAENAEKKSMPLPPPPEKPEAMIVTNKKVQAASGSKKQMLPDAPAKTGVLGYSFFKDMKMNETKNIHAFISIHHSESALRDTIRLINLQDDPEQTSDTVSIFTQNLLLYQYVNVRLIDPDSSFGITQVHDNARQLINETQGNHWLWTVTAKTKQEKARLLLKVVAEKPNGDTETFQARTIPINIHVHTDIFRSVWIFMYENPKIVLTAILLPAVGWIFGKLFGKKNTGKEKGKEGEGEEGEEKDEEEKKDEG